jgi:hypothetical protein
VEQTAPASRLRYPQRQRQRQPQRVHRKAYPYSAGLYSLSLRFASLPCAPSAPSAPSRRPRAPAAGRPARSSAFLPTGPARLAAAGYPLLPPLRLVAAFPSPLFLCPLGMRRVQPRGAVRRGAARRGAASLVLPVLSDVARSGTRSHATRRVLDGAVQRKEKKGRGNSGRPPLVFLLGRMRGSERRGGRRTGLWTNARRLFSHDTQICIA